jgi:uroporphyrinogen decarboxylase
MENLIATVGIDGKHSFEDAIIPAAEFHKRYANRIATLGGVDINILAAASPERVRSYTNAQISACAPRGRYAVGSGNSIPSYIPVENYLTMLDTALTWEPG